MGGCFLARPARRPASHKALPVGEGAKVIASSSADRMAIAITASFLGDGKDASKPDDGHSIAKKSVFDPAKFRLPVLSVDSSAVVSNAEHLTSSVGYVPDLCHEESLDEVNSRSEQIDALSTGQPGTAS